MSPQPESGAPPVILRPQGELNAVTSPELREQLKAHQARGGARLGVDLSGVSFIDSSGLGALVAGLKTAKLNGGRLVLFGLQEQARMIFLITQAQSLFSIVEAESDALALLEQPQAG